VTYTVDIDNIGSGATGNPVQVADILPAGFTYVSLVSVTVNGANLTGATTVNAANPAQPNGVPLATGSLAGVNPECDGAAVRGYQRQRCHRRR
jgi:uncharacterized repeat protein (TIGR01451 family)